jgi:hypothetical protein
MNQKAIAGTGVLSVALALACGATLAADAPPKAAEAPKVASSPLEAITAGKLTLNLRARYEHVDQAGKTDYADAFTNRTLLGWRTLPYYGISLYAEAIDVTRIGVQNYNDMSTASARYPTVADPEHTGVNQLYVDYTGLPDTKIRFGRQSLKLDNVRYVGNVEFRQVMQVLTGLWVENKSLPGVELDYGHFVRVKNIFDVERQARIDLFRAAWTFMPDNQLIGFAYLQDQPMTGQQAATGLADGSNRILGVRANGAFPIDGHWKLPYTAEYAKQDSYADGSSLVDAKYWRLGVGGQYDKTFVRADYEVLGSNNGLYAFQTPLGTNHLFQGWVDMFLVTPKQGMRDAWLSAGTNVHGVQLYTEYHDFRTDVGSLKIGTEWDVGVTYAFTKQLTGKIEYGQFKEGDVLPTRYRDTSKFWVTGIFNF